MPAATIRAGLIDPRGRPARAGASSKGTVVIPGATRPFVPVESIDSSCARCHEGHDVEPRAVVKRFLERSPGLTDTKSLVCTGCHGEHHLAVRTVHWDRKTGKLVSTGK